MMCHVRRHANGAGGKNNPTRTNLNVNLNQPPTYLSSPPSTPAPANASERGTEAGSRKSSAQALDSNQGRKSRGTREPWQLGLSLHH